MHAGSYGGLVADRPCDSDRRTTGDCADLVFLLREKL
jgi:hypothetical protein